MGGFKTFVGGEILTAADTNTFLMQGIFVFASASARDAEITSPVHGQFAFRTDEDVLEFFDGTEFVEYEVGLPKAQVSTTPSGSFTDGGVTFDFFDFTGNGSLVVTKTGVIDVLVVGGGGMRGSAEGASAGGSGGGVRFGLVLATAGTIAVTVGSGSGANEGNGSPSSFGNLMKIGGGGGGYAQGVGSGARGKNGFGGGGSGPGSARVATANGGGAGGLVFGSNNVDGIFLNFNGSTLEFGRGGTGDTAVANLGHGSRNANPSSAGRVIARIPRT